LPILLYCRPGFERDCAAEFAARAADAHLEVRPRFAGDSGYVEVESAREDLPAHLLEVRELVFARQAARIVARIVALPDRDRITPLVEAARSAGVRVQRLVVEMPDTNDGKTLSSFARRFAPLLERALTEQGVLQPADPAQRTMHVFFSDRASVLVAVSDTREASPHPMGIARLRMPGAAPSRSVLKLAEAFIVLVGEERLAARLRAGTQAVDLGAAPGGWSWQLAQRGLRVQAVDNGRIAAQVLATQLVEHVPGDAFHFRPRKPVAWMVCDVVEQPIRIAGLAADWLARGLCRDTIFNLKLPMKKRYEEWLRCRDEIAARLDRAGVSFLSRAKQLYHDREEITVYLSRTSA
jgi:23S rRNA (cytidine2498-2'-O)-methyltransferase